MNWSVISQNWDIFSPIIADSWDALTETDLLLIDGDRTRLKEAIGLRYSLSPDDAERRVRLFEQSVPETLGKT